MDKVDALHQVVEGLGCLIGNYPEDHPVAKELEKTRKNVLGLILGDKAGTLSLDKKWSEEFGNVLDSISEARIKGALHRMGQDEKVATRLLEKEQLKTLLAD